MWRVISSMFRGKRKPAPPPFEDGELGRFELTDEGWWTGTYTTGVETIQLNVNGVDGKPPHPDPLELENLRQNMARFADFRRELQECLTREAAKYRGVDPALFRIESIDHLWSDHSGHFFVYLKNPEDEMKHWRVEFFENKPDYLAFDK